MDGHSWYKVNMSVQAPDNLFDDLTSNLDALGRFVELLTQDKMPVNIDYFYITKE